MNHTPRRLALVDFACPTPNVRIIITGELRVAEAHL